MNIENIRKKSSFSFLGNSEIEEELYLSESYILFLFEVIERFPKNIEENILFSTSHSIVVYYGGILEILLWEYVNKYMTIQGEKTKIKKFCKIIEYTEETEILQDIKNPEIGKVYCTRKIKYEDFKVNINFNYLIKGCRDYKILSEFTIDKLDHIRKIRNGIHIAAIKDTKDIYTYEDLNIILKDIKTIFQEIKEKYIKI